MREWGRSATRQRRRSAGDPPESGRQCRRRPDRPPAGTPIAGGASPRRTQFPAGHKIAVRPIAAGEPVRKYDQIIGFATDATSRPATTCTSTTARCARSSATTPSARTSRPTDDAAGGRSARPSRAIVRADGQVGTRNYIGMLTIGELLGHGRPLHRRRVRPQGLLADYPERRRRRRADARHRLRHGRQRRGLRRSCSARSGAMPRHPNFAGVLLLGLGCEVNQIASPARRLRHRAGPASSAP